MLTNVAAIRSSSEILETVPDLAPEEHARFVSIIAAETSRLSDVAQALAAFFDKAHTDTRSITPVEEVDDFLAERNDYFPLLEEVAEAFRRAAGIEGDCRESAIVDYLRRAHGITVVERTSDRAADAREPVAFDAGTGTVEIADSATRATRSTISFVCATLPCPSATRTPSLLMTIRLTVVIWSPGSPARSASYE